MEDLDCWNRSKIQGLGKFVLSKILKVCDLKDKTRRYKAYKIGLEDK